MKMSREELEKLTTTKLRELAMQDYPEITGASAMKKDELVRDILKARGEPYEVKKKDVAKISDVKKQIKATKLEKQKAVEEKDRKKATVARKKIKQLKRKTRELAGLKKTKEAAPDAG